MSFSRSRGSSVSIVSDYGLDDLAIGVRSPAEAKDSFSNLCVQTGSEAHPASCTMGTGGPFPGTKRGRGVTLTTHPHIVPRSRMSRSYTSSPPNVTMVCSGTACLSQEGLFTVELWGEKTFFSIVAETVLKVSDEIPVSSNIRQVL
jgi:hypothetical protein